MLPRGGRREKPDSSLSEKRRDPLGTLPSWRGRGAWRGPRLAWKGGGRLREAEEGKKEKEEEVEEGER